MEILFSLLGRTEVLVVDTVEHEFLRSGDVMFLMRICQWMTCVLILATNVPLIIFIMKVVISLLAKGTKLINSMCSKCPKLSWTDWLYWTVDFVSLTSLISYLQMTNLVLMILILIPASSLCSCCLKST